MQIVIDIPEEYHENLLKNCRFSSEEIPIISLAIATGTPLPKGHGNLKDVSKLHYVTMLSQNPKTGKHKHITVVRAKEINDAPTIIERDDS